MFRIVFMRKYNRNPEIILFPSWTLQGYVFGEYAVFYHLIGLQGSYNNIFKLWNKMDDLKSNWWKKIFALFVKYFVTADIIHTFLSYSGSIAVFDIY